MSSKEWYENNRESVIKRTRQWSLDNPERVKENRRLWNEKNRPRKTTTPVAYIDDGVIYKECTSCHEVKTGENFVKFKRGKFGLYSHCRKCAASKTKDWVIRNYDKNKEKQAKWRERKGKDGLRNIRLKSIYGISVEDYNILLEKQDHKCAICGSSDSGIDNGKMRYPLYIDHCHSTGKIRGLLCGHCNVGIGNFRDDEKLLLAAIEYLRKTNGN